MVLCVGCLISIFSVFLYIYFNSVNVHFYHFDCLEKFVKVLGGEQRHLVLM